MVLTEILLYAQDCERVNSFSVSGDLVSGGWMLISGAFDRSIESMK